MGNTSDLITDISRIDDQLYKHNSAIPQDLKQEVLFNKKIAIGCVTAAFVGEALMIRRFMKNPTQITSGLLLATNLPIVTVIGVVGVYFYQYHDQLMSYLPAPSKQELA